MAGYEAGSVTAKVILNTEDWDRAIGKLKEEIGELQTSFNNIKGSSGLDKEIKQLKQEVESLQKENKELKDSINQLKKEMDDVGKTSKSAGVNINDLGKIIKESLHQFKQESEEITNLKKALTELGNTNIQPKGLQSFLKELSQVTISFKRTNEEIDAAIRKFAQFDFTKLSPNNIGKNYSNNWELTIEQIRNASQIWNKWEADIQSVREYNRTFFEELKRGGIGSAEIVGKAFLTMGDGAEKYKQRLAEIAAQTKATFETMQVELAKANAAQYKYWQQVRGSSNVEGWDAQPLQIKGYNDYLKAINEINEALTKFKDGVPTIYEQSMKMSEGFTNAANGVKLLWEQLNQFTAQQEKSSATYRQLTSQIQRLQTQVSAFSKTGIGKKALAEDARQIQTLSNKLINLNTGFRQGKINADQYAAELSKLKKQLSTVHTSIQTTTRDLQQNNLALDKNGQVINKNSAEWKKLQSNARQAGRGLTSFNNGVVQTAHSGRILSNTLYQIRGALLSLKMIFTAMGGMMLWGFAMDLAESVKQTTTAKNEMEAQLNQNSKVDASGIQYFRKELDKLTESYQKVNKYAVGETASSIGLEFNLNAKQMADALPIITMVQSEYVRAGRKAEEAALAVKDILQGEFQRLSRETGVGKEELLEYGWSGDKTDIDSLLKALKKAATDRHWDLFAQKATSLNDVVEITKSRFSEFGADVLDSITPAIVAGFNMIIDAIGGLSKAFNSMGAFGKNLTFFGGGAAGLAGILTILPMITKNMGLAEIATMGWGKSILTAALNLNKFEVAQYGFRKALAAVISGTKASQIANVRSTKAIMGRILGLKQSTLAEHGYLTAMVRSKVELKKGVTVINDAALATMSLQQKIIYLAKGEYVADKASATWGKTIKSLITSTKLWKLAILGITSIALVSWLASVGAWAENTKKKVEAYNDVLATGKDKIKEYANDVSNYQKKLNEMSETDAKYAQTRQNLETSQHNVKDMYAALKLAKQIQKTDKDTAKDHDTAMKTLLNQAYAENGVKNVEQYGQKYQEMKAASDAIKKSEEERYKFQYQSMQHINEHVSAMKEAGISEEQRVKYITEYSAKAEEAAKHLKKFNQGDMAAGFYYALDRLQLMWIDLWNDKDFINFWNAVNQTFNDLKPTLKWLLDMFTELGRTLMRFFSTETGRWVGAVALFGGALLGLGWKFRGTLGTLKDFGKAIWGRIKDLRKLKKTTEDVGGVLGEGKDKSKTTGGINGDIDTTPLGKGMKSDLKGNVRKYAKYMEELAGMMLLVSEAIVLLSVAMGALAVTGAMFKWQEGNIRAGIEGLKLVAPVVGAILVPIAALLYILDKASGTISSNITYTAKQAAIAIAAGILLVAEAILLLVAPMLSLAALGWVSSQLGDSVRQGVEAMKLVSESLQYLVPFIPAFLIGVAMVAVAMTGVGSIIYPVVIAGIATGLLLISGAIIGLAIPLKAMEQLGSFFPNLDGVRQGAEAVKLCAEAMTYVEEAMRTMTLVKWELLASYIADLLGRILGTDITTNFSKLSEPDGFFDQLNKFITQFNQFEFTPPDTGKVEALKNVSGGMSAVGDALKAVKTAMDNMPPEFKDGTLQIGYNEDENLYQIQEFDIGGYFEQFKEPLKELKKFIDEFNNSDEYDFTIGEDFQARVDAINQSVNMITAINSAVENLKTTMGNMAMGNLGAAAAEITGGNLDLVGWITGSASGEYQSSIGTQLNELEKVIKDLNTFNSHIGSLGGGEEGGEASTGNAEALSGMVTAVADAVQKLQDTLSQAVPSIKQSASGIGTGIRDGIKEGIGDLTQIVVPPLTTAMDSMKANAYTYGKGVGDKGKAGIQETFKVKDTITDELNAALQAMEDKKQEFYDKGYALGDAAARGVKDGDDQHSPGIMARTIFAELGYITDAMTDAVPTFYEKAYALGETIGNSFTPSFDMGGISVDELSQFQSGLNTVTTMANNTDVQTSAAFSNMDMTVATSMGNMATNVNTNFTNIGTTAASSYARIVNTTRTSLTNMQNQTTKNINAIRTSWRGMQNALIQSAENIRSETSSKIHSLENNMASFWNKVQNPGLLLASGAPSGKGTRNRNHAAPSVSMPSRGTKPRHAAGGSAIPNLASRTGSPKDMRLKEALAEYLQCLLNGGNCAAGGWNFNWSGDIREALLKWHTHFGEIYDDVLTVGKFENDNFPVRGIAKIAKRYIYDAISKTNYEFYYDDRYDPITAWNRGSFNCVDGARLAIAFADKFGFGGGSVAYGSWGGTGHGFAVIPGLGVIDATAIQNGYGFTSPKVSGYPAAGTRPRKYSPPANKGNSGTNNYNGDVNLTIHVYGDDVEVDDTKVDKQTGRAIIELLGINPATGL